MSKHTYRHIPGLPAGVAIRDVRNADGTPVALICWESSGQVLCRAARASDEWLVQAAPLYLYEVSR